MSQHYYDDLCLARTARKDHICYRCKQTIKRGERYLEYIGETPAFQSGDRYHLTCAVDAGLTCDRP